METAFKDIWLVNLKKCATFLETAAVLNAKNRIYSFMVFYI